MRAAASGESLILSASVTLWVANSQSYQLSAHPTFYLTDLFNLDALLSVERQDEKNLLRGEWLKILEF